MPEKWTAESLPPELTEILDAQAGKVHSAAGAVRACLADVLNAYDEMRTPTVLIEFPATVTPAEIARFKQAWADHRGGPVEFKIAGQADDD
jgi:hypothetical protein